MEFDAVAVSVGRTRQHQRCGIASNDSEFGLSGRNHVRLVLKPSALKPNVPGEPNAVPTALDLVCGRCCRAVPNGLAMDIVNSCAIARTAADCANRRHHQRGRQVSPAQSDLPEVHRRTFKMTLRAATRAHPLGRTPAGESHLESGALHRVASPSGPGAPNRRDGVRARRDIRLRSPS